MLDQPPIEPLPTVSLCKTAATHVKSCVISLEEPGGSPPSIVVLDASSSAGHVVATLQLRSSSLDGAGNAGIREVSLAEQRPCRGAWQTWTMYARTNEANFERRQAWVAGPTSICVKEVTCWCCRAAAIPVNPLLIIP